ncbi:excisionase family DNA binding protein [Lachnospiraceae bacterium PF1-21]|uniref:Helix-turn-helix domain-containing protein n=1 Tax=Ohessyouella blattaphilus TaxID=2949333 RepID=A0ABT1EHI3_9FIRM|nr:helix-turn-helix domain-containing protein [Ohessyouella blattaphilus]MCP1109986.1 helix-turn-helix domain-containing protein [Ohessyouella blattaphilus]MCR8563380.1 helix-turn-helix domain-containing protein [Ohessyouella blattaphilus]MDL2250905.1 helix-turn-helix domain-containing protein [Lachnospiraceae bacterium OttesenSCG-928-J05]
MNTCTEIKKEFIEKNIKISLTVHEAAEYTGIGRNALRKLLEWEAMPVIYIGRKILIRVETLDRFIALNEGKDLSNRADIIAVIKKEAV